MKRLFVSLFILGAMAGSSWATSITVSGDVSGVWDVDTVFVAAGISIPGNDSLSIAPGVKVIFQGHYKFTISSGATLKAQGTPADTILFTASDTASGWWGMRFMSASDVSILEYCRLTHSRATGGSEWDKKGGAIYCSNSSLTIRYSRFDHCNAYLYGGAIHCQEGSSPLISQCFFEHNDGASGGGAINLEGSLALIENNIIKFNVTDFYGGGIRCSNGAPVIEHNLIHFNKAGTSSCVGNGGGMYLYNTTAAIRFNQFEDNIAQGDVSNSGGGLKAVGSSCRIYGNVFSNNTAAWGGGVSLNDVNDYQPIISGNIFEGNHANNGSGISVNIGGRIVGNIFKANSGLTMSLGGGINCSGNLTSNIVIENNVIADNAAWHGAGMYCKYLAPTVKNNLFFSNQNDFYNGYGGGLYLESTFTMGNYYFGGNCFLHNDANVKGGGIQTYLCADSLHIYNSTFSVNNASSGGSAISTDDGVYSITDQLIFTQDIFWLNGYADIVVDTPTVTTGLYTDFHGSTWPGQGNISIYPAFVDTAHDDYRLLWGSPCIDSGNPDSLDPDGTRADMGAFYFDQSVPVRVLLTPHQIPYLLPAIGGSMNYTLSLDNWADTPHIATAWCDVTLPDSSSYGPVVGPATVTVPTHTLLARNRTQVVPAAAPFGVYHYNAYAVVEGDTSRDSFMFGKLGVNFLSSRTGGWNNTGEGFSFYETASGGLLPMSLSLYPSRPNPFNATTVISYKLQTPSRVNLQVYDPAGRLVTTLVDGMREAGTHELSFDGSELASGMYFLRMQAGDFSAIQKLVLLK